MDAAPLEPAHLLAFAQAGLFHVALALYASAWLLVLVRPRLSLWLAQLGVAVHLLAMTLRGWAIGFFPLTNKMESFSAAAVAVALVAVLSRRDSRLYSGLLLGLVCAALTTALSFSAAITYPPPLMQTLWYPLHVPLSFFAYALWSAAAAAALVYLRERNIEWLALVDYLALAGFGLWSLSMITGGIWGVLAWGAYFLWDVKVLWSVILWFHYATFLHLKLAGPAWNRPALRAALAVTGFGLVLVAYVGTSFFFGRSSHAF